MPSLLVRMREILRDLRWSRRETKTAVLACLCIGALPGFRQLPLPEPVLAVGGWSLVALGLVFAALTVVRLWRYSLAPPAPEIDRGGVAIKGASSFAPEDAKLFSRLGRLVELKQLRSWARDTQKAPVVAVMGESGVGKTSLLRAGLAFILGQGDDRISYAYWEADPRNPRESFLRAVEEQLGSRDFASLPQSVIVADQLEQLNPGRHPEFFQLLAEHLQSDPPHRVTWIVAFRREFASTWADLLLDLSERARHRPEMLSLRRFTTGQAKQIFATLAEQADLPVRRALAEQIVEEIAEEGSVSPVDLGITLQVLHRQPKLADDPAAFRALGGHAGLLTFYLEMLLEAHPPGVSEEIFRALLALIDEDEERRLAEGRRLDELLEIARPRSPRQLAWSLEALAQPGVRVLEPVDGGSATYRLVHERFIPAIRRLSGEILSAADRASRLLERRLRLWQREGRRPRYLLQGGELREVLRHQAALLWGSHREEKLVFVGRSRRRRAQRWTAAAGALALASAAAGWILHVQQAQAIQKDLFEWGFPRRTYEVLPRVTSLATQSVTSTSWLRRTERLTDLELDLAHQYRAEEAETLPASLRRLVMYARSVKPTRWPAFPTALEALTIHARLEEGDVWPVLPASLRRLEIYGRNAHWPALPATLEQLAITDREADDLVLSRLPPGLRALEVRIRPQELALLAHLRSLQELTLEVDQWRGSWPPLPSSLETLAIRSAGTIQSLTWPEIPDGVRVLGIDTDFYVSSVGTWPDWPPRLEELTLQMDDIGGFPPLRLPATLRRLKLKGAAVGAVAPLAEHAPSLCCLALESWEAFEVARVLKSLPPRLQELEVNARIESWPSLPPSLERFTVAQQAPEAWPALAPGLRELTLLGIYRPRLDLPAALRSLSVEPSFLPVELPDGLRQLELRRPRQIPELPAGLQQLTIRLGSAVPGGLQNLSTAGVEHLGMDLVGSAISSLPALPETLRCFRLRTFPGAQFVLPEIPPGVEDFGLDITGTAALDLTCSKDLD
ncbi:MAG TPA: hypothetical protein VHQ65_04770 [Thermoanaerobaculia bacterium]|nr:hypothetical protein [Thermoanaerobaculia bacterium]